jgi:molybdenum cofactor cytidylyltransferase
MTYFANHQTARVHGLVLAAGKSERMGSPKPLLPLGGKTFLERVVDSLEAAPLAGYHIVLGHQAPLIIQRLPRFREKVILNPEYERGQLSSLTAGLQALDWNSLDGILLCLIDHPLLSPDLIRTLVETFSIRPAPIIIPVCRGKRGHPVIFARSLFAELMQAPPEQGAVAVVCRHQQEILHLEVEDEGILMDVDTPEEYENLLAEMEGKNPRLGRSKILP